MKLAVKEKDSQQQAAQTFEVPQDALRRRVNWTLQTLPEDASHMKKRIK